MIFKGLRSDPWPLIIYCVLVFFYRHYLEKPSAATRLSGALHLYGNREMARKVV